MNIKEGKRELIIKASVKLFAKDGFHGAKISSIAQAAGVGKGTIYEYFESKSQLYEEMVKYTIDIYMNSISYIFKDTNSTKESLRRFVDLVSKIAKEHMDIFKIHEQGLKFIEEKNINIIQRTQKRVLEMLEEVIIKGIESGELRSIDTKVAALSFLGSVKYITIHHLLMYKESMTEEEVDRFVDLYINGLKK